MSRYIDADMIEYFKTFNPNKGEKTIADMAWRSDIDAIPTADVAPVVHGEWITNKDGSSSCSVCKFTFYPLCFKYCPHCGAKMDADVIRYLEFLEKLKSCGTKLLR